MDLFTRTKKIKQNEIIASALKKKAIQFWNKNKTSITASAVRAVVSAEMCSVSALRAFGLVDREALSILSQWGPSDAMWSRGATKTYFKNIFHFIRFCHILY